MKCKCQGVTYDSSSTSGDLVLIGPQYLCKWNLISHVNTLQEHKNKTIAHTNYIILCLLHIPIR